MSLDIYLINVKHVARDSIASEPYIEEQVMYADNITHNLADMAKKAGLYKYLWRPDEVGCMHASDLISNLTKGLEALEDDPQYFKQFEPSNGYGTHKGLVVFVRNYLAACKEYPRTEISVNR